METALLCRSKPNQIPINIGSAQAPLYGLSAKEMGHGSLASVSGPEYKDATRGSGNIFKNPRTRFRDIFL